MLSKTDEMRLEDLTEEEFLVEEAARARAAIRRTVGDLKRAGREFAHPREAFGSHPWLSTGLVIGVGAVLGLAVYEIFFRDSRPGRRDWRISRNGWRAPKSSRSWTRPIFRTIAWLTGAVVQVLVPLAGWDRSSTSLKPRHR